MVSVVERGQYGWLCVKPACLQPLNHIRVFLVVLFLARALYVGTGDGAVGVVVSTLERRFDLSSSQSSWIASIVDISSTLAVVLFTVLGTKYHRPRVLGIAVLTLAIASFLFTVPHIASPVYELPTNDDTTLCNANFSSPCHAKELDVSYSSQSALATMLSARFLVGAGYPAVSIQGFSYLDDAVSPGTYAFYAAVMDISTLAGTTFTYATGSSMLKLHTYFYNPGLVPNVLSSGDTGWIGAWWLLFIAVGMVCLPVAAIIAGFPRNSHALGTPEDQQLKSNQMRKDGSNDNVEIPFYKRSFIRNIVFWNTQLYRLSAVLIIFGIAAYSPKYMEIQFNLSPTMAGISLGGVLVLSGTVGSLAGGAIIPRYNLNCKGILRIMTVFNIPFFATFGVFLLNCSSASTEITQAHFIQGDPLANSMRPLCSDHCGCADIQFNPICGADGVQYFSPCHAGCTGISGMSYSNCSCVSEGTSGDMSDAVFGSCPKSTCYMLPIFLAAIAVGFTFCCAAAAMQNSAVLRCVSKSDRTGALGFNTLQACLGGIAGPVILGWAFDDSCSLWDYPCGERGVCLDYNKHVLNRNISILWALMAAICTVTCFIAWRMHKPNADSSEEADFKQEQAEEMQPIEISNSKIYKGKLDKDTSDGVTAALISNGHCSGGKHLSSNGHLNGSKSSLVNISTTSLPMNGFALTNGVANGNVRRDECATALLNGHANV